MKLSCEKLTRQKLEREKKQKQLASEQKRKQKARQDFKRQLTEVSEENPDVGQKLKKFNRQKTGRPSLQEDQPQLLQTIIDIVSASAAADDRRRTETLTSCKTLDDLHVALQDHGFSISRAGTYLCHFLI